MLIRNLQPGHVAESDVTPESRYLDRRALLAGGAAAALGLGTAARPAAAQFNVGPRDLDPLAFRARAVVVADKSTPFEAVTQYNNFYEFGTAKTDPANHVDRFRSRPWTVQVDGLVHKPGAFDIDTLLRRFPLEERIYRLRCVEAWSMVIPWVGFPLARLIDAVEPLASARFVAFQTLADPRQMPGLGQRVLNWPYVEGLRLDEARHPLSLLAVGLYGRVLPSQNGAPVRLVVPWKYGFKSIKSIVRIRFTDRQPRTSWNESAPDEYGFYSNVNPAVDHPRWSQKKERRIGELFRRETLPFNGYADEVASLYRGMNLRRYF